MGVTAPTHRRGRVAQFVENYQGVSFLAFACLLSWSIWGVSFAAVRPVTRLHLLPGAFGPALAATALVRFRGDSVRAWLADGLDPRVGRRWYAVAFGLPVALGVCVAGALYAVTGTVDTARLLSALPMYPVGLAFTALLGGGQEEFGWRGFALPALQQRHDALTASVVIGVVWAVWHLPLFVVDVPGYADQSFAAYLPLVVGLAVLFTWLYNGSGGSVLLAVLMHGSVNVAPSMAASVVDGTSVVVPFTLVLGAVVWAVALVLLAVSGRESLADGERVRTVGSRNRTNHTHAPDATAGAVDT